jgi:hypothetical protein
VNGVQPTARVRQCQAVDPLRRCGEGHSVAGLTRPDRQADGEVGLARARRAQEHDVALRLHEVEGAEVGDHLPLSDRW